MLPFAPPFLFLCSFPLLPFIVRSCTSAFNTSFSDINHTHFFFPLALTLLPIPARSISLLLSLHPLRSTSLALPFFSQTPKKKKKKRKEESEGAQLPLPAHNSSTFNWSNIFSLRWFTFRETRNFYFFSPFTSGISLLQGIVLQLLLLRHRT